MNSIDSNQNGPQAFHGLVQQGPIDLSPKGVERIERAILSSDMPKIDFHVEHHFSKGVYARELHIPAGAVLTGKIHKHQNLNILLKGEMSVLTENGIVRVKAPFTIVSPPGTKRIAFAHEDCIWTTIHGTDETDVAVIEREFTADSADEYALFVDQQLKLGGE